jgi:Ca2+-binding RTX toxin-like protein
LNLSTLNGTNGFKMSGGAADDRSGYSVASAGDVNGDGFADLIVGAPLADSNGPSSGASYVVFGRAGGFGANLNLSALNGTNGFKISGAAASDYSGRAVASAGDVNGDGFDDLIVGAGRADPNGGNSGASYVVFGRASGFGPNLNVSTLDGTKGFRISGEAASDYSGESVASAGDVNGDGLADLIVGAPSADSNGRGSGASYVVFGRAPDAAVSFTGAGGDQRMQGGAFGDRLSGLGGDDRLFGLAGDDTLDGGTGEDRLEGGSGDDVLIGRGGADTLVGGDGNDVYLADADDTIIELADRGTDTVRSSGATFTLSDHVENGMTTGVGLAQTLSGNGAANRLTGDGDADTLRGMGGADALNGGAGGDRLAGGTGRDLLTGGAGADVFVYEALADSVGRDRDRILDFSQADGDRIDLSAVFGGTIDFIEGAAFSGIAGQLRQSTSGTSTLLELDTDGDKRANLLIGVDGAITFTDADFLL